MELYQFVILVIVNIVAIFVTSYFKKKGANKALKEDVLEISYKTKLGENIATKKDISEITQRIEDIKNSISFRYEREHNFIKERESRLLKILELAEDLRTKDILLVYLGAHNCTENQLIDTIKSTTETYTQLTHNIRIMFITLKKDEMNQFKNSKGEDVLPKLLNKAMPYYNAISVKAHNMLSLTSNIQFNLDLYSSTKSESILKTIEQQQELLNDVETESCKELWSELHNVLIQYLACLSRLYKKDFHLIYNLDTTEKNN